MTIPALLAELFALTRQIATAPTELAADALRVHRVRVEAELVARTGAVS